MTTRGTSLDPRHTRRTDPSTLVSVVVPAFNVERYLDDCLASILTQSHRNLEVVIVDDGSTDGTAAIAARAARRDPRVRVVHQPNAGLGAARNVGTALATGAYLAFADSDDLVLPGAYERLVATLETSGSDLAIGAAQRLRGATPHMTPLMRENHRAPLIGVDVEQAPLLLADCFAWNKLFRRSFWDRSGVAFPTDVRYEDQPAITRALVAARRIDSLPGPVYQWRVRDDGTSISQQRGDVADLEDRIRTKRWSTSIVRQRTSRGTQETWFARVLPVDMWEYFRSVPGCTDAYWELLRSGIHEFWGPDTIAFEHTGLPRRQRIMGRLVAQGLRDQLEEFLSHLDSRRPRPAAR